MGVAVKSKNIAALLALGEVASKSDRRRPGWALHWRVAPVQPDSPHSGQIRGIVLPNSTGMHGPDGLAARRSSWADIICLLYWGTAMVTITRMMAMTMSGLDQRKAAAAALAGNGGVTHIYILDAGAATGVQTDLAHFYPGALRFFPEGVIEGEQHGVLRAGLAPGRTCRKRRGFSVRRVRAKGLHDRFLPKARKFPPRQAGAPLPRRKYLS